MGRKGRGLWDIESFFVARRGNDIVQNGLVLFLKDHSYFHSAKVKAIWRTSYSGNIVVFLAVTNIFVLERRVFYKITCCNVLVKIAGTLVLGTKCLSFLYHDLLFGTWSSDLISIENLDLNGCSRTLHILEHHQSLNYLRSFTCPLTGFFWLLSHVMYLKLTKVL